MMRAPARPAASPGKGDAEERGMAAGCVDGSPRRHSPQSPRPRSTCSCGADPTTSLWSRYPAASVHTTEPMTALRRASGPDQLDELLQRVRSVGLVLVDVRPRSRRPPTSPPGSGAVHEVRVKGVLGEALLRYLRWPHYVVPAETGCGSPRPRRTCWRSSRPARRPARASSGSGGSTGARIASADRSTGCPRAADVPAGSGAQQRPSWRPRRTASTRRFTQSLPKMPLRWVLTVLADT